MKTDPKELFGDLIDCRTDWPDIVGQFCHIWLSEVVWPEEWGPKVWDKCLVRGRVVGESNIGLWFECTKQVMDVKNGEMERKNLHHFFIPFSKIRGIAAPAVKNSDILPPEKFLGLKPNS